MVNGFKCVCPPQWTGKTCQLGKDLPVPGIPEPRLAGFANQSCGERRMHDQGVSSHSIVLRSNLLSEVSRPGRNNLNTAGLALLALWESSEIP